MFDFPFIIAAVIVILAACLQSVTGFGFALLAVPLFLLVFDAKTAVGLSMIISFFTVSALSFKVRKSIMRSIVFNLLAGALVGIPFGIYIFYNFNQNNLKIMISIVVILLSIILISGYHFEFAQNDWADRIVGSISGVMTASIGMPGPPIVLCLNNRGIPKDQFRATFACYNALVYVFSILFLLSLGAINKLIIIRALTLVPMGFIGSALGNYIFPRISQRHFQKGVPILVLVSAVYSLYKIF
ncbi:MAG: hypothetical protein VR72_00040 [Clostridiaceae bacterium BRH_c20a]|nr:MAG: hypothetical protein VR72_00040 [Clostridiaceae bacterium BRH_c20a]